MNREFSNPTVASSGCSYTTLGAYTGTPVLNVSPPAGQQVQTRQSGEVVVLPSYGGVGYGAFSRKNPSCTGYYNVSNAYACNRIGGASSARMCG
jgi:hypothetical protein